jgi:hypothetical protein
VIADLIDELRGTQNRDGGWGAGRNRPSNTEATALAALALGRLRQPQLTTAAQRGLAWLVACQRADGSWPLLPSLEAGSWATSLALICLSDYEHLRPQTQRGVEWLLGHRGRGLGFIASLLYRFSPESMPVRVDPDLRGWSWTPGAFSWVEPTAYALIALKKSAASDSDRGSISEGERLLYDRMCGRGGWNYGNSTVLGTDLPPYPETTALALIALQHRRFERPNQQSLATLKTMLSSAVSGLALSWAVVGLAIYGEPIAPWVARLAQVYARRRFLGETKTAALALLAATDGPAAFRFPAS